VIDSGEGRDPATSVLGDDPARSTDGRGADAVWAFDVDGCLVDSMSGSSLRPLAREVLLQLHRTGSTLLLWSAGGREHAAAMAERHAFTHLLAGIYDKGDKDEAGCLLTGHLPPGHRPDVVVDDRPEDAPAGTRVIAVAPYMAPDDADRGLAALLAEVMGADGGPPREVGHRRRRATG
jgi:long-chain acyl-CoA synthetase